MSFCWLAVGWLASWLSFIIKNYTKEESQLANSQQANSYFK
jgi:hypothetical protein